MDSINRDDIWYVDLGDSAGSRQGGKRPAIIVSNNVGNRCSPICSVVPLTSRDKTNMPTHGVLDNPQNGLFSVSTFLAEQIVTIDKSKLLGRWGRITSDQRASLDLALRIAMDLAAMENGRWRI